MAAQDTANIGSIRANIKVHSVYQEMQRQPDGTMAPVWMIDYSPGSEAALARIRAPWDDFIPDERGADPHSAIGQMAQRRFEAVKAYVDAAQKGQEVVNQGTALGLWSGLDSRRAEILRQFGIRTVEEFLAQPESMIMKLGNHMPDVRYYIGLAASFLDAAQQNATAAKLAERDAKIEMQAGVISTMQEEMATMKAMMQELLSKQLEAAQAGDGEETRRRGGRKPLPRDENGEIIREPQAA